MSKQTEEVEIPTKEELLDIIEDNDEVVEDIVEESPEYSDIEAQAIEKGWKPEGVEGKRNLSAEEFLDRQTLYDDLHSVKRKNKRLENDLQNVIKYQDQIRADERKKVMAELKLRKREALDEGDHDRVIEIDEQIAEEREKAKEDKKQSSSSVNEDFEIWVADNSWYNTDDELRAEADVYGEVYWNKNPTKTRDEVYKAVSAYIKRSFSDKFENTRRSKPAAVDSTNNSGVRKSAKTKYSEKDLSSEERDMMRTILRTTPGMTKEEYLQSYFDMQG